MTPYPSQIINKIDWVTLIYRNVNPFEVFESLGLAGRITNDVVDAFDHRFLVSGAGSIEVDLRISTKFGNLEVHYQDLCEVLRVQTYKNAEYSKFFFTNFPYIRFDMSATHLDAMREYGVDVDSIFFKPISLPEREGVSVEFSRGDFAFDLLNYAPEFIDKLEELISDVGDYNTCRVPTGSKGGCKFSIKKGCDGHTVYLGSKNSPKLLRIYDKGFQYRNSKGNIPYYEDQPDGRQYPFSWIRIELQTRREITKSMMETSGGDFLQIWRFIYDKFAIMQSKGSKTVSVLWQNLFNVENVRSIIQNAKSVSTVSNYDRAEKYVENVAFRSIFILLAKDGWDKFKERIEERLMFYQTEPDMMLRWNFILSSAILDEFEYPDHLKRDENGFIIIE